MSEQPLFDSSGLEAQFLDGTDVIVQTIWGDEKGKVIDYFDGLFQVALQRGDVIYIPAARLVIDHAKE